MNWKEFSLRIYLTISRIYCRTRPIVEILAYALQTDFRDILVLWYICEKTCDVVSLVTS